MYGIIAPKGMVLQVLGNLYGLPSSGRNFSKAVDILDLKKLKNKKSGLKSYRCDDKNDKHDLNIDKVINEKTNE